LQISPEQGEELRGHGLGLDASNQAPGAQKMRRAPRIWGQPP